MPFISRINPDAAEPVMMATGSDVMNKAIMRER
jgi:hypothetical protein